MKLSCYIPTLAASGLFYLQIVKKLKVGRQDSRKKSLSIAFCVLWLSWILFCAPYVAFEFYLLNFYETGVDSLGPEDVTVIHNQGEPSERVKFLYHCDIYLRSLNRSYGFINSLLMLILLKPFQEPIRKGFKKMTSMWIKVAEKLQNMMQNMI